MKQNKSIGKGTYLALVVMILVLFAGQFLGLSARGSGLCVGYSDRFDGDSWEARYVLHNGFRERVVNVDAAETILTVNVETKAGTLDLRVTDMSGRILMNESFSEDGSCEVSVSGKVTVRVTGDSHRGSFSIAW